MESGAASPKSRPTPATKLALRSGQFLYTRSTVSAFYSLEVVLNHGPDFVAWTAGSAWLRRDDTNLQRFLNTANSPINQSLSSNVTTSNPEYAASAHMALSVKTNRCSTSSKASVKRFPNGRW